MSGRHADAMVALATTRGRALTGYAYLLTGSVADAEDLVQEALLEVFLHRRGAAPVSEAYVRRAITAEAIADRLGLATGTVKRYLSLATDRLEHLLGPVDRPAGASEDLTVEIGDGHGH